VPEQVLDAGDRGADGAVALLFRRHVHSSLAVATKAGGSKAVIGGGSPAKRSTSTRQLCALQPCERLDAPTSGHRTLGLPCLSSVPGCPGTSGSYHAPVAIAATPGRRSASMARPARHA